MNPKFMNVRDVMSELGVSKNKAYLVIRELNEELIAQGQNGNVLLTGIDGVGSHAEWYIEDEYTRKELSFDTDEKKQEFLTEDAVKKIFDLKTKKAFEDNIKKSVVTRPEKFYLLHIIKNLGLNDYSKIAFCEEHCGSRVADI